MRRLFFTLFMALAFGAAAQTYACVAMRGLGRQTLKPGDGQIFGTKLPENRKIFIKQPCLFLTLWTHPSERRTALEGRFALSLI
jgi:hypothetical protein